MSDASIFTTDPKTRLNSTQRSITLTWELGEGTDFDGEPCTAVAQLLVMHSKNRKCFSALVQRIDLSPGTAFTIEKYSPSTGTDVRLASIPCGRYSAKALEDATDRALAELRSRLDEPDVIAVADPESPA